MLVIPAIDLKEGKCVRLEQGLMDKDTYLANNYREFFDGGQYFEMSGTSQAAAHGTSVHRRHGWRIGSITGTVVPSGLRKGTIAFGGQTSTQSLQPVQASSRT